MVSEPDTARAERRDGGSALIVAIVLVAMAGASVTRLASYGHAVHLSALAERRQALLQVSAAGAADAVAAENRGATGCFAARAVPINGLTVTVSCTTQTAPTADVTRRGLITTANSATTASVIPPSWAGSTAAAIAGDIVVNTGTGNAPASAVLDDITPTWQASASSWTGHVTIPVLPPLPVIERPGPLVTRNGCTIYYPGRYLGTTALVLSGGQHYFASGVYYLERPLTVNTSARVVMGAGDITGCTTDALAVSDVDAPTIHQVTGGGVTLIFGASGRLTVQESSLVINRRLTTSAAADSDSADVAIRFVSAGANTSTLTIPADQMRRSDGTIGPLSGYATSTVSATLSWALDIRLNGTSTTTNRLVVDGYVHAPVSGSRFTSSVTTYALQLGRGLTTSRVSFALATAPNETTNYRVGFVPRAGRARVVVRAQATTRGRTVTAERVLGT